MPGHLAIVPAYNESASISRVVSELREHAPGFDVVVVDDGSTDDTSDRARSAGAQVLRHPYNLGIGGAVQSGYMYASERGYDVAVQVDGDGQHDPRCLAYMLEHLDAHPELDMVTRLALPRRTTARASAPRRRAGSASGSSRGCCRASSASR